MIYKSELNHHGKKGQKWGVKNGPPYPLVNSTNQITKGGKTITGEIRKNSNNKEKSKASKKASSMTDQELKEAVTRMNLENQYSNLSSQDTKRGLDYTDSLLNTIGGIATIAGGIAATMWTISQLQKG